MTSQEVLNYCNKVLNHPANLQTLWRWKRGYYIDPKTKKIRWYFADHSSLPHKNKGRFKGFEFELHEVTQWVMRLESGLDKPYGGIHNDGVSLTK